MSWQLPLQRNSQPYFEISALEAGFLTIPDRYVISSCDDVDSKRTVPSLVFVLKHSKDGKYVLFDLGIKKNVDDNALAVKAGLLSEYMPCYVNKDVAESLNEAGVEPTDVHTIIISHLHWDHIGDHHSYTKAQFLMGGPARALIEDGYPVNPNSRTLQNSVPESRTTYLSYDDWEPVGPFERGLDYFGDGSLYLIDAVGHLQGHLNALVRNSADDSWVFLAGDSVHDCRILRGEKEIADYYDEARGIRICAHVDKAQAEDHLRRIVDLKRDPKVEVILSHDDEWYAKYHDSKCWPRKISVKAS